MQYLTVLKDKDSAKVVYNQIHYQTDKNLYLLPLVNHE